MNRSRAVVGFGGSSRGSLAVNSGVLGSTCGARWGNCGPLEGRSTSGPDQGSRRHSWPVTQEYSGVLGVTREWARSGQKWAVGGTSLGCSGPGPGGHLGELRAGPKRGTRGTSGPP
ncbi:unnamed protein product [Calypogeia fissa]